MTVTTLSFFARGANLAASNADLNVRSQAQVPVTLLTFAETDGNALSFTYNGGLPDPDTVVYLNGSPTPTTFTVDFTGALPLDAKYANIGGMDLRGDAVVIITTASGQRFFFLTDPAVGLVQMQAFPNGAVPIINKVLAGAPLLLCFAEGTRIDTPAGPRRIEALRVGEAVSTLHGSAPLRLIAARRVGAAEMAARPDLRPIRIPAHALGAGLPRRDLRLSPQHRLWFQGWQVDLLFGAPAVLLPAKHLTFGGIGPVPAPRGLRYFHLLLDAHEIVFANGLPCESWQPAAAAVDVLAPADRARFLSGFSCAERHHFLTRLDAAQTLRAAEARALSGLLAA